jgi:uncharacterized membrane protein
VKDDVRLFLGIWGIRIGTILVILPIAYDLIGILYGRDMRIGVGFYGTLLQIIGLAFAWIGDRCEKSF